MCLHVEQRYEVLLLGLCHADEVLKLLAYGRCSRKEMVTPHLHTMPACVLYVGPIAVLLVSGPLGGLHINILDRRVLGCSSPVDIFLIVRDVNTVIDKSIITIVLISNHFHLVLVVVAGTRSE